MGWSAGVAEVDITPPRGVWMTGFANRVHPAEGIHDPLKAQALAIKNDQDQMVVLVSMDLVALTADQVKRIRQLIRDWSGLDPSCLMLNASHTHSGPAVGELSAPWMGLTDPSYLDVMVRKIATCAVMAQMEMKPAHLHFGTAESLIGINRRQKNPDGRIVLGHNPQGPVDRQVDLLLVTNDKGRPMAALVAFACHPVILGPENYLFSADFVGVTRQSLSTALDGASVLFLQGCAGNINPRDRGTFSVAETLGNELAQSAVTAAKKAETVQSQTLRGVIGTASLPYLPPPSVSELRHHERLHRKAYKEAKSAGRLGEANWRGCEVDWAKALAEAIRSETVPKKERINLQVLQIGDILFLAMAAETFTEIGLTLRQQSPLPRTIPLGFTNGCVGYLPTASAYREGGYEVDMAFKYYGRLLMIGPQSEQIVINWLLSAASG
ncbi:MAG: neutral/alkaline non-lysosomal ceramidase N-terminal domain-containing protein [Armatimonadetes bacterium]|nr:neutral/alkaline non-lysosomal ceramidase N-terminal domain-containing protein [Armatimonadota bacterium]MDW8120793.1 neutral/alkaline non-lysosomal ceramidase N-terminal domain-containing protein [Armatimonadota bacterium]